MNELFLQIALIHRNYILYKICQLICKFQLRYTGRRVNVREYSRVLNWNTRKRFGALNPKQPLPPLFYVFVLSSIPPRLTRLCRYMSALFISFDMEAVAQRKKKSFRDTREPFQAPWLLKKECSFFQQHSISFLISSQTNESNESKWLQKMLR